MQLDDQQILEDISLRLRQLRYEKGCSAEDLANMMGVNRSCMNRYESKKANLTILSLHRVLSFHGISFQEFFSMELDHQLLNSKNKR